MNCPHGKKIDLVNLSVSCVKCNTNVLKSAKRAKEALGGRKDLKDFLNRLLELAQLMEVSKGSVSAKFLAIERFFMTVLTDVDIKEKFLELQELTPRLVYHDIEKDTCYVMMPWRNDQKWSWVVPKREQKVKEPEMVVAAEKDESVSLTARLMNVKGLRLVGEVYAVPVESLRPFEGQQTRRDSSSAFSEAKLLALGKSMQEKGQQTSIKVRQRCGPGGIIYWEIMGGDRRCRAAKLVGMETLKAEIYPETLSDKDAHLIMVIDNLNREEMKPMEEAQEIARSLDGFNYTPEQIGQMMGGKSAAYVLRRSRLCDLSEAAQDLMIAEDPWLSVSAAFNILDAYPDRSNHLEAVQKWIQYKKDKKNKKLSPAKPPEVAAVTLPPSTHQFDDFDSRPVPRPKMKVADLLPNVKTADGLSREVRVFHDELERALRLYLYKMTTTLRDALRREKDVESFFHKHNHQAKSAPINLDNLAGQASEFADLLRKIMKKQMATM